MVAFILGLPCKYEKEIFVCCGLQMEDALSCPFMILPTRRFNCLNSRNEISLRELVRNENEIKMKSTVKEQNVLKFGCSNE